jgi:hypothetical protein
MSENLFLGDSTYPHTPSLIQRWAIDPEWQHEDIEILEDDSGAWVTYKDHKDRIEQLERELVEAQKGHARYEYERKLNVQQFKEIFICNLAGVIRFDDLIDQSIEDEK